MTNIKNLFENAKIIQIERLDNSIDSRDVCHLIVGARVKKKHSMNTYFYNKS